MQTDTPYAPLSPSEYDPLGSWDQVRPPLALLAARACAILVVASEPDDIVRPLAQAGYDALATQAHDGALETAVLAPPALVIVDDGEEGLAFVERLQRRLGRAAPPFFVLIAEDDEAAFERALTHGATDALARPVPPALLRAKVARHARRTTLVPDTFSGYSIRRVLGRGGMGTVFLAERDGFEVALKVVFGPEDAETRARFQRECRALERIDSPGVPRFIEAGEHEGRSFLAMSFVPGRNVSRALEHGGPFASASVLELIRDVGTALAAVHEAGVVHRDVKPSNVIVTPEGGYALVDLGLARAEEDPALTRCDQVMGTLPYLAPEVLRGGPASALADAFSLGMTALTTLHGRAPLVAPTDHELASRIATGDVPRARDLASATPAVAAIVDGLLAHSPEERLGVREAARRATLALLAAEEPTRVLQALDLEEAA